MCRFVHDPAKKGIDSRAIRAGPPTVPHPKAKAVAKEACGFHRRGICNRGEACPFSHQTTATRQSTRQVQQARLREDSANNQDGYEDDVPIVISRPTRFTTANDQPLVNRRQNSNSYDFQRILASLPVREPPPRGYHFGSDLPCRGCPDVTLHVIWDGGAEGTSISDAGLSCILNDQKKKNLPPHQCGINYMSRMSPHQNFLGFASQGSAQNIRVEIQAELILTTLEGEAFPPLLVRLVPGQHDDLLVAAPDLDK